MKSHFADEERLRRKTPSKTERDFGDGETSDKNSFAEEEKLCENCAR